MRQGCVFTLIQGHISKVKVTEHTIANIYVRAITGLDLDDILDNYCLLLLVLSLIWCHDLHPRSYLESSRSRSQCTHDQNLCLGHNSSLKLLSCWIWILFHILLSTGMTESCVFTLTQGHISNRVNVAVCT